METLKIGQKKEKYVIKHFSYGVLRGVEIRLKCLSSKNK